MSVFLFIMGFVILLLSFFIAPLGTSNALMISAVLFVLAIVLLISKSKKLQIKIYYPARQTVSKDTTASRREIEVIKVLSYFKFFLFMIVGFSVWQVLFTSFSPVDVVGVSLFATFFKWLYEVVWERKPGGKP